MIFPQRCGRQHLRWRHGRQLERKVLHRAPHAAARVAVQPRHGNSSKPSHASNGICSKSAGGGSYSIPGAACDGICSDVTI